MQNKRSTGLILMGLAVAAFLGSTSEALPPEAFFPALALFSIGAVVFFKSSRAALAEADRQTQAKLHPTLRENRSALAQAERQAQRRGAALSSLNADAAGPMRPPTRSAATRRSATATDPSDPSDLAEIELVDVQEEELQITQDVSFPIEIQRGDALADQLRKLNLLLTQGILTEQEYAIAKAKLLA
ncbi:MAG: SHOCT domain-containing protein [Deltaproteobacteria bacterium]|nr:SHOCT domain-containing protein [Deltaproteobacteria bacterium]